MATYTMETLQLVDTDLTRAGRLGDALQDAGWKIRIAGCARAALSLIRLNPPQMVVVHAAVDGISAGELCVAIKEDSALRHIPVVLYAAGSDPPAHVDPPSSPPQYDLTTDHQTPSEVARAVGSPSASIQQDVGEAAEKALSSSLEDLLLDGGLRLGDIVESLVLAGLSGRLTIGLDDSECTHTLILEDGQIVQAVSGVSVGDASLGELLDACDRGEGLWYQFDKTSISVNGGALAILPPPFLDGQHELEEQTDDLGTQEIVLSTTRNGRLA